MGEPSGMLLSLAPRACDLGHLLRAAIDAEQVGAARLHLAADQPEPDATVLALRRQTSLVLTAELGFPTPDAVDRIELAELILDPDDPPKLVAAVARIVADHPGGVSVGARGGAALPVLLAAIAAGGHVRVGTADAPPTGDPRGGGRTGGARDDVTLVARAAGVARLAGRPPLDPDAARRTLGLI